MNHVTNLDKKHLKNMFSKGRRLVKGSMIRRFSVQIAAATFLFCFLTIPAMAEGIISAPHGGGSAAGGSDMGQSFTATCDGTLSQLKVLSPDTQTNLTITIYAGEGPTGAVLGTVTGATAHMAVSFTDYSIIDLSAANVSVTNGNVYTFYLTNPNTGIVGLYTSDLNHYPGGEAYYQGAGTGLDFIFILNIANATPEINVQGNNTSIVLGDTTPSLDDHTDFGTGESLSRTFTIQNQGDGTLTLGSNAITITGTNASDFSVNTQPPTTIVANSSATFVIDFNSTIVSVRTAEIHINSDDIDEPDYYFSIKGIGALVNAAPTISLAGTTLAYIENDAVTQIDAAGTVSDADGDAEWNGGTLEVQITANAEAADEISISDTDGDGIAITVSGTKIFANGTDVGDLSISGGTVIGGTKLTNTFNSNSTSVIVQEILRSFRYRSTSDNPGTSNRTATITVTDNGAASVSDTRTISVTAINDEPTLSATGSNPTFTEDGSAATVFSSASASTVESGQTLSACTMTITNVNDGFSEILNIDGTAITLTDGTSGITATNSLGYSVSVSGTTATISLSGGTMSTSALQTLINAISYQNNSNTPNTSNRVVTLTSLTDSGSNFGSNDNIVALSIVSTITVNANNDAPTLTSFASVVETTTQNTEIEITLAELKAQANEKDVDGTVDAFIVKALSGGTLKIGANSATATDFNTTTNNTINATNNAYWTPDNNAYGTKNAFTTTVLDNNGAESTGAVQAIVKVNDVTNPEVSSITLSGSPASTANSITYIVTFTEPVVNVSVDDFSLTKGGTANGTIASVSASSGTSINVIVNGISGTGALRLDLNSSTNIADASANTSPASYNSGAVHDVDRDNPTLNSSVPIDGATGFSASSNITLTFNENIVFGTGNIQIIDLDDGSSTVTINVTSPGALALISTNTLTLNPASDLEENTNYAVQLATTAIDDSNGNSYSGILDNTTLNFTILTESTTTGDSSPTPQPITTGVDILVNGVVETAATSTTTTVDNKTVTTITLDDKKMEEKLKKESNNFVVTIPFKNDLDVAIGQLTGQTVKNMESKEAVLEIKTENVTYTLPASEININNISSQIGNHVELKDIKVNVRIAASSQQTTQIVQNTADRNSYQVVVKPVDFEITCSYGNKTVEVSKFNGYVERMVVIPDGIDPSKITTGIVLNKDGTFSHVPTSIVIIDGKYYAKINSLTNSSYSVIFNEKSFDDVSNHWAKDAINDMGSRLVIGGVGDNMFEPDRDITRAEYAKIVVNALGLMKPDTGKDLFNDVTGSVWYYDAIYIANEYGLISGYGNGEFGPDDKITREQAMAIISRAMQMTKLNVDLGNDEIDQILGAFNDSEQVTTWAKKGVASCVQIGIVSGKGDKTLAPQDKITRAEVAVIVRRLLQKSSLI